MIVVEFFKESDGKLINPCGSDWTHIMEDIKTAKGARNRVTRKGYYIPKSAVECRIFRTSNVLNENSYTLLDKFSVI